MKRIVLATVVIAVLLGAHTRAQSGYQLLQQALSKEQAEGNLKDAIAIYQRIGKEFAGDHALAAQALLHLGECYQKLGDAQARQVFERIVREYADQRSVVATARERLGNDDAAPRAKGDRPVWSGGFVDGFGTISPDGRYLTYTDWAGSASLMVHDLVTGTNRRLTGGTLKDGATQYSVISRDGRHVAYEWRNPAGRYELRVADLQGTGIPEARRVLDIEESREIAPFDWSPDNRWIAVHITRKDQTGQIALVRVADGSVRVLKSVHWKGPLRMSFSPDGRYIAYDIGVDDQPLERRVYVMTVDGSREALVADDHSGNAVMGWSPDGRQLLVSSDRSGAIDLWAVPMSEGRPAGTAFVAKPNIGTFWSNGISANGTMYIWKEASPIYLQIASIDLAAGRLTSTPAATRVFIASRGRPAWSQDGKQLVYISCNPLGGGPCRLFVRSTDTGRTRQINTPLNYLQFPQFTPDAKWLITLANDGKGRRGVYRIDVATGETTIQTNQDFVPSRWNADGRGFIYRRNNPDTLILTERDVSSGEEREFLRAPLPGSAGQMVSPDKRLVAVITAAPDTREDTLSVIPVNGSAARTLLRVTPPARLYGGQLRVPEWTPDSRSVLVAKTSGDDADRKELWQVPVDGSAPRRLDIDVSQWITPDGGFHLSPDGKQIVFVAATGRTGQEIWALENFLPGDRTAK